MHGHDETSIFNSETLSTIGGHSDSIRVIFYLGQFQILSMHLEILIDRCFMHRMNKMMDKLSIIKGNLHNGGPFIVLDNQCRHKPDIQRENKNGNGDDHARQNNHAFSFSRKFHTSLYTASGAERKSRAAC